MAWVVVLVASGPLGAPGSAAAADEFFASPSRNIGCLISGAGVRCDVRQHSWKAPPKPSSCDLDWGNGVQVGTRGRASYTCAGDTVIDPDARRLAYGRSIRVGRFTCTSTRRDMRCRNRRSGHGFRVSRASVKLF